MNTPTPSPDKIDVDHLALRAPPRPVTRLNRRTLALGAGVLACGVLGATLWSLQAQHRPASPGPAPRITDNAVHTDVLDKVPRNYSEVPKLGPPQPGDWGAAAAKQATPAAAPAVRHRGGQYRGNAQENAQAAASPLTFRTTAAANQRGSNSAAAQTAQTPAMPDNFGALPASQPTDPTQLQNQQAHKEAFLSDTGTPATRASGTLQPPPSPWAVMAGTVIAAALVTGINSDLPGQIIATVTEPVYDAQTGRTLLIPQGSRLLGSYDSQIAFGQRRVLVVWTRLIFPDSSSITLDRLPGVDAAGNAGLEDGVDWHWHRIFAGAAVSTLIGVGAELAAPDRNGSDGRVIIATRESLQDSINQVGQELTRRSLNIQPTLTERPGLPLRVIVNKDLMLRPYQPLFYERNAP